ncbi:MAG: hypothetical protein IIC93_03495, partial [Chloroflexi bacterium]|nr:hypothetical protein [Chloroflexota bacterium]
MKSQKLTFLAAAIGVIAIAAIACGSEPVASDQRSDVAPPASTEDRIPVEPDGGIGDGALPLVDDNLSIPAGETSPATPDEASPSNPDFDRDAPDTDDIVIEGPGPEPVDVTGQEHIDVALPEVLCITTEIAQMPIEFHFGSETVPTGFDRLNSGSCTFPEDIESVTVTLHGLDGSGPSHTAIWTLPETTTQVGFPLPKDLIAMETRAFLSPGQYERSLTATGVSGTVYDVANASGALMEVTLLAPEGIEEPEAPAVVQPLCMTTLAVQAPIEFFYGSGPVPTGFDGANVASCTFGEEIERVEVILTAIDSGHVHTENFRLTEATTQVSFPLP